MDQRKDFISNYNGQPLVIVATGAGSHLFGLTQFPGASKVIYATECPYSEEAVARLITSQGMEPPIASSVSLKMLEYLDKAVLKKYGSDLCRVVVTGALITNRYRRGNDHAYISIDGEFYYIKLPKLTEMAHALALESSVKQLMTNNISDYRLIDDENISNWILKTLLNENTEIFEKERELDVTNLTASV